MPKTAIQFLSENGYESGYRGFAWVDDKGKQQNFLHPCKETFSTRCQPNSESILFCPTGPVTLFSPMAALRMKRLINKVETAMGWDEKTEVEVVQKNATQFLFHAMPPKSWYASGPMIHFLALLIRNGYKEKTPSGQLGEVLSYLGRQGSGGDYRQFKASMEVIKVMIESGGVIPPIPSYAVTKMTGICQYAIFYAASQRAQKGV